MTDAFAWIEENLAPRECTSVEFLFDDMDSQSGRCLPDIYVPFDPKERSHWGGRGACFDFLHTTGGPGSKLLDFGPGDGWPSLIVAPHVGEVVGVDGSRRRVATCTENAGRMGIENATFLHVEPGQPLPFPDASFDGAMAASSLEQAPDPTAALSEIHRVLSSGGRLRIHYEALSRYRGGLEREIGTWPLAENRCALLLYDRDIEGERVRQYRLTLAVPSSEVDPESVTAARLETMRKEILDARVCVTTHPSGWTWAELMKWVGFREALPTHSGGAFASRWFDELSATGREPDLDALEQAVKVVVAMPAPLETEPRITAVK